LVRIATDISIQRPDLPLVPFLQPFFPERANFEEDSAWGRRFAGWAEVAHDLVEVTTIEEADVVVMPVDRVWVHGGTWSSRTDKELAVRCRALSDRARAAGKPVIVFFTGDRSCDRVDVPDAHVFREGPFRSRMSSRDHAMPAFAEDFVMSHNNGELVVRDHVQPPVVGFCGLAGARRGWKDAGKRVLSRVVIGARQRWIEPAPQIGEQLRARALACLAVDPMVAANIRIREHSVFLDEADLARRAAVRAEYVTNLAESDYVLCARGSGNFSFRLYEALCMGRTPVIIDTDVALPTPERIDWSSVAVMVPQRDLEHIGAAVAEFHRDLTAETYAHRQHELRRVWLDELSPEGFFRSITQSRFASVGDPS
jgi:hypothetical protein